MEIIIPIIALVFFYFFYRTFSGINKFQASIFKHVDKSLELSLKEREAKLKGQQDYECNNCHATVSDPSNISPSGDVKCIQCNSWFNVYQE